MTTKTCTDCKLVLPVTEFHKDSGRKDGLQYQCKACQRVRRRSLHARDPERYAAIAGKARLTAQQHMVEYLRTHPCVDCGESDPLVLDFDHLRDKVHNVSFLVNRGWKWDKILLEIEKCEVVCANDHRRRTATRSGSWYRLDTGTA